jgi:hypothetical protein
MPQTVKAMATKDHNQIKRWVEERGGHPAVVENTGKGAGDPGVLRIDYPGYRGQDRLKQISWDDFFKKFDANELSFLHQDKTATGRQSRFNKLVRQRGPATGARSASNRKRANTKG